MRRAIVALLVLGAAFVALVAAANLGIGPLVVTREDEQKLILRFRAVRSVTEPGLGVRIPLIETMETYDRRSLYLSTEARAIQMRDGEQLNVDNYIIWRIEDPVAFRRAFPEGMSEAEQRIDRALRDDVREVIGRHTLTEVLKDRRAEIMQEITKQTRETLADKGIAVTDVRTQLSLVLVITLASNAIILFCMYILGAYLGRTYWEVKGRPAFIVHDVSVVTEPTEFGREDG